MTDSSTMSNRVHPQPLDPRKVWVISGRNIKARTAMFQLLRSLDLVPTEWSDAVASTGQGAPYIGSVIQGLEQAQAIIVLLTGDDYVQLHPDLAAADDPPHETSVQLQPRPNVVFEAGMALGNAETRDRTILVQVGRAKLFSNVAGRHLINMSNWARSRNELANILRMAGCPVRTSGHEWLEAGDFESAILAEGYARGASMLVPAPASNARIQVHMAAENGPGAALVRVENRGETAVFAASATVTDVSEQVLNRKFLQTYALRWRSNGRNELALEAGERGSLLIASTGPSIARPAPTGRDLYELLLEGFVDGQPAVMDRFRWHAGDQLGAVTAQLDVIVSSTSGRGVVVKHVNVKSMEWGGIMIEMADDAMRQTFMGIGRPV
jgi:predicted nucleotide-binding protein